MNDPHITEEEIEDDMGDMLSPLMMMAKLLWFLRRNRKLSVI